LLTDRFKLTMHRETKEFPIYSLGLAKGGPAPKPSTTAPPPAETPDEKPPAVNVAATGSGNGVAVDLGGGSTFAFGNNKLEVRKMTMISFAEVLTRFVDRVVLDRT